MKTAGIICEYNPFHFGHSRQLRLIREQLGQDTAIVCVMSGNYVQRGEPAMWDKYTRARAAIACGADLVLELPVTCVLQSAEGFAKGGVEILSRLGHVDYLSFGAECGDGTQLMNLAQQMETETYRTKLRSQLDLGLSYAAARQAALDDSSDVLSLPNNILGLEYCRAILTSGSHLEPLTIQRTGSYHATTPDSEAPSATAIRSLFPSGNWDAFMPTEAAAVLEGQPWYHPSYGERAVLARLRSLTDTEWEQCAHGSEGLWSKAMKAARSQPNLEAIIQAIKSKRYPRTRIQRLLLCAYLGITNQDLHQPIPYVRILAAGTVGRTLLRQARKTSPLPLINPGETPENRTYYALEAKSSDLFTLFSEPNFPCLAGSEQVARLF